MTTGETYVGALERLRAKWATNGILSAAVASQAEIAAFEKKYSVVLPPDVRTYFATINGTAIGSLGMDDEDLMGFWHLDQVRTFAEEGIDDDPDVARTFVFADHSIWIYGFGIRLSSDPSAPTPVVVTIGSPHICVASSFEEFIERYVRGDQTALYPEP